MLSHLKRQSVFKFDTCIAFQSLLSLNLLISISLLFNNDSWLGFRGMDFTRLLECLASAPITRDRRTLNTNQLFHNIDILL